MGSRSNKNRSHNPNQYSTQNSRYSNVTVPHMMRDVLIASLNKGQFPLALVGCILIIVFLRMPAQDLSKFLFQVLEYLREGYVGGYILFGLSLVGWYSHSRFQRRFHSAEVTRIADERNKLQSAELGRRLESSN